jgi:hypothetical protein
MVELASDFRADEGLPSPVKVTANPSSQWLIFSEYLGILNTTETDIEGTNTRLEVHAIHVSNPQCNHAMTAIAPHAKCPT